MRVKFDVELGQLVLRDDTMKETKRIIFNAQKTDEIPDGYPKEGYGVQLFGPDYPYEPITYSNLGRDKDGWYMHITFSSVMTQGFSTDDHMQAYIAWLRQDGWQINLTAQPESKTDA